MFRDRLFNDGARILGCDSWGYRFFNPEFILLSIIALMVVGIILYLAFSKRKSAKNTKSEALEILKLRYVKGEISDEEYERRKEVLKEE